MTEDSSSDSDFSSGERSLAGRRRRASQLNKRELDIRREELELRKAELDLKRDVIKLNERKLDLRHAERKLELDIDASRMAIARHDVESQIEGRRLEIQMKKEKCDFKLEFAKQQSIHEREMKLRELEMRREEIAATEKQQERELKLALLKIQNEEIQLNYTRHLTRAVVGTVVMAVGAGVGGYMGGSHGAFVGSHLIGNAFNRIGNQEVPSGERMVLGFQ